LLPGAAFPLIAGVEADADGTELPKGLGELAAQPLIVLGQFPVAGRGGLQPASHFERPNFPILSRWYPPGVQIALVPLAVGEIVSSSACEYSAQPLH
jgi:hypothetical protein